MDLEETGYSGVKWIYLIRDRDLWPTFVNTVINITPLVSINSGYSLFPERLLTPAGGLPSMGLFIAEGDLDLRQKI
jgi:hypothetical protein